MNDSYGSESALRLPQIYEAIFYGRSWAIARDVSADEAKSFDRILGRGDERHVFRLSQTPRQGAHENHLLDVRDGRLTSMSIAIAMSPMRHSVWNAAARDRSTRLDISSEARLDRDAIQRKSDAASAARTRKTPAPMCIGHARSR
ncbi:hypothetical protein [Burkholderia mayonis]|uniref:hypothetical protein n=1 Tax=Burkholderia mayonis TaxID=1385591 RepID=UPI00131EEA1A|nr:hypothetical protein [Burkholderia mayonis]